jgi:hypothetical protein
MTLTGWHKAVQLHIYQHYHTSCLISFTVEGPLEVASNGHNRSEKGCEPTENKQGGDKRQMAKHEDIS